MCHHCQVHGDIRHLENRLSAQNSEWYVHGDIRHLEILTVGQSASFSTVEKHLKTHGVLKKSGTGKGWVLDGLHQNLLSDFQQKYYAEPEYALKLQKMVLNLSAKEGFIIDSENTADVEDNLWRKGNLILLWAVRVPPLI